MAVAGLSGAVEWGEVNTNTMRKIFSLSMVALLALTFALAALGCGKKEEAPAASSTEQMTPPADSTAMACGYRGCGRCCHGYDQARQVTPLGNAVTGRGGAQGASPSGFSRGPLAARRNLNGRPDVGTDRPVEEEYRDVKIHSIALWPW